MNDEESSHDWFRPTDESADRDMAAPMAIKTILEKQGLTPSEAFIEDAIHACRTYRHRLIMEMSEGGLVMSPVLKELKDLESCLANLGYDTLLLIGHESKPLETSIKNHIESLKVRKGRPTTWARDTFIYELINIFVSHTNFIPGLAYRRYEASDDPDIECLVAYDGPFFCFVKSFFNIVIDSPNISDSGLHSSIRKILAAEKNLHDLRKKYWKAYKRPNWYD